MARKVILETAYTFTPVTKTVVIPRHIPRERLLLITNVTANQVIYNFSDPNLKATSYTATVTGATGITTLVLNYNTGAMNSTDKLQFTIDDPNETFEPSEAYLDPTNKLRTSSPQALIDTDFEYGSQTSKWENLALTNNRPFAYASPVTLPVTAMTITGRVVTVTSSITPAIGTPIIVADSYLSIANGVFVVDAASFSSGVSFTYTARATSVLPNGSSILDANKTTINSGSYYTGAAINPTPLAQTAFASDAVAGASKITVTFTATHGLSIGNEIQVYSATGNTQAAIGAFFVSRVVSPTVIEYYTRATQASPLTTASDYNVYARAAGTVLHRPFDGGVIFSANSGSNYATQIRQTRRYFRYQSGKGIQMSSGSVLKPSFQVDSLVYTLSTNTVAVTLKDLHNIQQIPPGSTITVSGANEAGFNGTFTVTTVTGYNSFTYTPTVGAITANTTASGNYYVSTSSWWGAVNRLGIFDQQNGLFFEFDGQQLYAVRRNSTYQLSGRVDVTNGSTTVGQNSIFSTQLSKQLTPGDFIVIKGQSYRVDAIGGDNTMTIAPAYRGATATAVIVSKTIDTKIPQSQWNQDKMDGTGPSGYTIDLTKMQMFYIDYSWYGAGFVRWGIRAKDGNVAYVHKLANNNVNSEAYMRSGNLPGRYETSTLPPVTTLSLAAGAVATNATSITVGDNSAFPPAGVITVRQGSSVEHVYYGSKTGTTQFTSLVRAQAGATGVTTTAATTSSIINVSATTGIQVGQRVYSTTANAISDGTFVTGVSGTNVVTLSQPVLSASPTVIFGVMSTTAGIAFTPIATTPVSVELSYPSLAPTISHWGTSVIMDGRYDDDKSLLFTYGQNIVTGLVPSFSAASITSITGTTAAASNVITVSATTGLHIGMTATNAAASIPANTIITNIVGTNTVTLSRNATAATSAGVTTFSGSSAKALMSIRVSPSVDAGVTGILGARELINRMQLVLRTLDVSLISPNSNILVTLVLNGVVNASVNWTNAVGSQANVPTSSLAQIADYAGQNIGLVATSPGEVTGGFFVSTTGSVDLSQVRDLGNSVLGGGGTTSAAQVYPDGPDVMTIYAQNVGSVGAALTSRLSWTEAQA